MDFSLVTFSSKGVVFETAEAILYAKFDGVDDDQLVLEALNGEYSRDGCPLDERKMIELVVNSFNYPENYSLPQIFCEPFPYYFHKPIKAVRITINGIEIPIGRLDSVDSSYQLWQSKWRNSEIQHIVPIRSSTH